MVSSGMIELQFYLSYNGVTSLLQYSPDGWNEELINWTRSTRYWGMFRKFTIPLQFVKFGAKLCRIAFYTSGINAEVSLIVKKRNKKTGIFEQKYTGYLDFSTFSDKRDYVEISAIEGGLSADVQRRESTMYNIPLPLTNRTKIYWSGEISNFETFDIASPQQFYDDETKAVPDPTVVDRNTWVALKDNNFKDINDGVLHFEDFGTGGTQWYGGIIIDKDCDLSIKWSPNGRSVSIKDAYLPAYSHPFRYGEKCWLERSGVRTEIFGIANEEYTLTADNTWEEFFPSTILYDFINGGVLPENRFPAVGTYHFEQGDKITFEPQIKYLGSSPDYFWRFNNNSSESLSVDIFAKLPNAYLPAITAKNLFTLLADKIGGYPVKSDFLDTYNGLIIASSFIRDMKSPSKIAITTSIGEFFDALNTCEEIGMGVEVINGTETLVIEKLDHFLSQSITHHFSAIKNENVTVKQDLIPSEIEIGFNYSPPDDYYGRLQYNGSQNWETPSKRLNNKLSWMSQYRTDILGVDNVRLEALKLSKNANREVESKTDKTELVNWIVDCKYDYSDADFDYYYLNRDYDITDVAWPESAANVRYTPKRCLLRHEYFLSSAYQLMSPAVFTFASASKNYWISTKYTTESSYLFERYPFDIPTNPLFYPFLITFDAACKIEFLDAADSLYYGLVSFDYHGITGYGYIMDASVRLSGNQSGQITLLLASINDLNNFKR